jgi:hypothetical protein
LYKKIKINYRWNLGGIPLDTLLCNNLQQSFLEGHHQLITRSDLRPVLHVLLSLSFRRHRRLPVCMQRGDTKKWYKRNSEFTNLLPKTPSRDPILVFLINSGRPTSSTDGPRQCPLNSVRSGELRLVAATSFRSCLCELWQPVESAGDKLRRWSVA